jgi:2-desacetyl-2-hydroxyethyl bacteriochlorophyllide A dehydrogenase
MGASVTRKTVIFSQPYRVGLEHRPLPEVSRGTVLVQTRLSAVSAGSELLVYKGQVPMGAPVDTTLPSLAGSFNYPLKYGYSAVGRVTAVGSADLRHWLDRMVFCFHPHESHFLAAPEDLIPVPEGVSAEEAVFLANMETAVNLVMDGHPIIGEAVVVFGQGIVGLLTTALLAEFPLGTLVTLDAHPTRRRHSRERGAQAALDPQAAGAAEALAKELTGRGNDGRADLVYELSGNPQALNLAVGICGFGCRIVVGSWYGTRPSELDLGLTFHRNRVRIVSSQVSTVDPALTGRWSKKRRLQAAWEMIRRVHPGRLISHRIPIDSVGQAYELLDRRPEDALQVVLVYDGGDG